MYANYIIQISEHTYLLFNYVPIQRSAYEIKKQQPYLLSV